MDLEKVKLFYKETWWLWTIYAIGCALAIYFIHWIFVTAIPIVGSISLYFALIRGPSSMQEDSEASEEENSSSGDDSQDASTR